MSQQKYLQDLIAAHQGRLEELKKASPVKSSFKSLKGLLGIEPPKPDKTETLREIKRLEAEIKRLQAELKKIEAAKEVKPVPRVVQRETLSTTGFAPELIQTLQQAALIMRRKNKQVMTVEIVLLAILTLPKLAAHSLLYSFSQSFGFDRRTFFLSLDQMSDKRVLPASNIDFVSDKNERTPLARELLAALNKGAAIAKAQQKNYYDTAHLLAAIAGLHVDERLSASQPPEGAASLFQRVGITHKIVIEALTGRPVLAKNEQQNRSTSAVLGKTKEAVNWETLTDIFMIKVVFPLDLGTEAEAQIRAECEWLCAAVEHYRHIQQVKVDKKAPIPVSIPPTAKKTDPRANNTVIELDSLSLFNYSLIGGQIDGLIGRINIYFNNLNYLLKQEVSLPDAVPVNIALKNQIKGTRHSLANSLQEAAILMQPIYGVIIPSPAELVEFLD